MRIRINITAVLLLSLPMVLGSRSTGHMPSQYHYPEHRKLVRAVVKGLDLWSANVEELVLRTGAVESLYHFRAGLNEAPERGFWQIHPETASDILFRYLARPSKHEYRRRAERLLGFAIDDLARDPKRLEYELRNNDVLGILLCRLWYVMSPYQIPSADNIEAQAMLWKKWFNTQSGGGSVQYFVSTVGQINS